MTIRIRRLPIAPVELDVADGPGRDRPMGEGEPMGASGAGNTGHAQGDAAAETAQRFYGVYPGVVTHLRAPDGGRLSQVQLRFPWLSGGEEMEVWARYMSPMAGGGRGAWFLPDIGDEVLVAFEAGDVRRPYVLGGLWNGPDEPPEEVDPEGKNRVRSITTRGGIRITLEDVEGGGEVTIETPHGCSIVMTDGEAGSEATLRDGLGNEVTLKPGGLSVRSSSRLTLEAPLISASAAMVELESAVVRASGVVQCDTLIANSVVSSSYTPGAGNIW